MSIYIALFRILILHRKLYQKQIAFFSIYDYTTK